MRPAFRLVAALASTVALALSPALALGHDDHKHKNKHKHGHHRDHSSARVVEVIHYRAGGGPPPWAPAHGWRRKHEQGRVAYYAPYGIATGVCQRTLLGAAVGGTAGGLIASELAKRGHRAEAIAGGALLGILIGGSLGNAMDQLDERCVGQVLEHAGSEQTVEWRNPDSGAAYQVTPTSTWQETDGRYCREYTTTVRIGGELQRAYGTACRQPDGSWERVG